MSGVSPVPNGSNRPPRQASQTASHAGPAASEKKRLGDHPDILLQVQAPYFASPVAFAYLADCPKLSIDSEFIVPRNDVEFYCATDRMTGARMIVKVLPLLARTTVEAALMLRNEINVCAEYSAKCGEIISPRYWGVTEFRRHDGSRPPVNVLYSVMDRYDGTLENYSGTGVPLETRRILLEATFHATATLHRKGLIHRDIKPANVLVYETTKRLVLSDMQSAGAGCALRELERISGAITYGTWEYMAPEQATKSIMHIGFEADVFALGLLMHKVLVGSHPRENFPYVTGSIHDPRMYPLTASRLLSPAMRAVFRKATAFNPAERYRSADELAEDFRKSWNGEFVQASKFLRFLERPRYWCSGLSDLLLRDVRGRTAAALGGLVLGIVGGYIGGYSDRPSTPPVPPTPLREPKEKLKAGLDVPASKATQR